MTAMTPVTLTGTMPLALGSRTGLNLPAALNAASLTLGSATATASTASTATMTGA